MTNKFLEKIASTKYKEEYAAKNGVNFGKDVSNASIRESYGKGSPKGSYATGDKTPAKKGFMGLGAKPTAPTGQVHTTGDSLASGPNLKSRLKDFKTEKQVAKSTASSAKSAGGKLFSKAVGFARKNPLVAAGGALATGLAIGNSHGKSKSEYSSY